MANRYDELPTGHFYVKYHQPAQTLEYTNPWGEAATYGRDEQTWYKGPYTDKGALNKFNKDFKEYDTSPYYSVRTVMSIIFQPHGDGEVIITKIANTK